MSHEPKEKPKGSGTAATLRIIAAVVVLVIAGGAILQVLGLISLESFKGLALQTALVGGVVAVATVVLGVLSGGGNDPDEGSW